MERGFLLMPKRPGLTVGHRNIICFCRRSKYWPGVRAQVLAIYSSVDGQHRQVFASFYRR
ncbi:MAG: hypothetical protein JWP78_219 [Mucilaginibacter sp.]|nr:hypothetical protein [Mucilaginibacter sp.]